MTTTLRPILPALLLALAACVVDTDDLKPKTDAECADLGQKACGPRCVGLDDPATGCANAGCAPCPGGPSGMDAFCNAGACDYRAESCEPGKEQCDGLGGCEDLQSDEYHCGGCYHACWLTDCVSGICAPAVSWSDVVTGAVPIDLAVAPGGYFLIADGAGGSWGNGVLVRDDWISGLGTVDRLEVDASGNAYVSSLRDSQSAGGYIRYVARASTSATHFFAPEGEVRSMAMSPYELWITTWGGTSALYEASDLLAVPFSDPWASWDFDLGALAGVAYVEPLDQVVFGSEAGELVWFDVSTSTFDVYRSGLATPTQIAIFQGTIGEELIPRTIAFWASEDDGSVRAMELPDGSVWTMWPPAGSPSSRMDISADASGVYWSDFTNGVVAEWRAPYDDVVLLSRGGNPLAVVGAADFVYWADLDGNVRSVPK